MLKFQVNSTVEQIRKEMKENGSPQADIDSVKWNHIVASAVSQPLEHDLDYMYKNFSEFRQLFIASLHITNVYNAGQLKEFKDEQPDMYSALKLLWLVCAEAVDNNFDAFAKCIITPEKTHFLINEKTPSSFILTPQLNKI